MKMDGKFICLLYYWLVEIIEHNFDQALSLIPPHALISAFFELSLYFLSHHQQAAILSPPLHQRMASFIQISI